jgi:hypothetical protein
MHAHDVVFIRPAGHELLDVAMLQRFIKGGFNLVGVPLRRWLLLALGMGGSRGMELPFCRFCGARAAGPGLESAAFSPMYALFHCNLMEIAHETLDFGSACLLALTGCGYNDFQRLDEQTKAAWSEVLNQYQRRADLVPNIVATVKGEANFEQETLTKVIEARAKATSIQVTPETLNNPEAFKKFQAAQGELGSALSRLMVVRSATLTSRPTRASATCGFSWRAPRTASPWRATATSRRSRSTTCWPAVFPAT